MTARWLAPTAVVCGDVQLGEESNLWFGAVLRGDVSPIILGRCCNIQDGAVLHGDPDQPTILGDYVTVGHRAIIHSAQIGDDCLIGMGAVILSGVTLGAGCLVGAGAVVTKSVEPRSLVVGTPARSIRTLSAEKQAEFRHHAQTYWQLAIAHQQGKFPLLSP